MHHTSLLVTMEGAFLIIIGVMAIMTVEITVMNMDVSYRRGDETLSACLRGSDIRTEQKIYIVH